MIQDLERTSDGGVRERCLSADCRRNTVGLGGAPALVPDQEMLSTVLALLRTLYHLIDFDAIAKMTRITPHAVSIAMLLPSTSSELMLTTDCPLVGAVLNWLGFAQICTRTFPFAAYCLLLFTICSGCERPESWFLMCRLA